MYSFILRSKRFRWSVVSFSLLTARVLRPEPFLRFFRSRPNSRAVKQRKTYKTPRKRLLACTLCMRRTPKIILLSWSYDKQVLFLYFINKCAYYVYLIKIVTNFCLNAFRLVPLSDSLYNFSLQRASLILRKNKSVHGRYF